MLNFFAFTLLILLSFPSFGAKICYFSLNNTNEFQEMNKLTQKLKNHSKRPIEVIEFVTTGSNAEESFQKMIASGQKCDGLVISGHHTGSFGGKNASSNLSIDFMEKLSCDEKNKEFFNNIKALWLQGCRTLGVGVIEAYDSADFHTERVGAVLTEDHLAQSFANLNMEFSSTLDQDNPLSSRYLRVFPRATTFGWTKTAPGQNARSEFSIPYHLAHIAALNDDRKKYFEDPTNEITPESAVKYAEALFYVLGLDTNTSCDIKRDESLLIDAWKRHGNADDNRSDLKFAFNNPDLNAFQSLLGMSHGDTLKTAKNLECFLKNAKNEKEYLGVVDKILENEALLGYSFNSLHELYLRLQKEGDINGLVALRSKFQNSVHLQSFLMKKLSSKELGILRKIDYYSFWKDITNSKNESIESTFQNAYVEMILKPAPAGADLYDVRDFKETLTQSMSKHGILDQKTLQTIVNSPKSDAYSLVFASRAIRDSKTPIEGAGQILQTIVNSPKSDAYSLEAVASAIRYSNTPIAGAGQMLQTIVNSPKSDAYSLAAVARAILDSKTTIEGAGQMLQTIVNSPKSDAFSFAAVASAIGSSKTPIQGAGQMLQTIVNSPKSNSSSLADVASAIGTSETPIEGAGQMLQTIVNSPRAGIFSNAVVASVIGASKTPIEGAGQILQTIVNSPKSNSSSLADVAKAIGTSKTPIEGAGQILQSVVKSPKAERGVFIELYNFIPNSNLSHEAKQEILRHIQFRLRTQNEDL